MQLSKDDNQAAFTIKSYQDGTITINDQDYTQPVILTPENLIEDQLPNRIEELNESHVDSLLELNPGVVIIGTGPTPKQLPPQLAAKFLEKHIGVEVMHSNAACKTYNILMAENRNAVLALFTS